MRTLLTLSLIALSTLPAPDPARAEATAATGAAGAAALPGTWQVDLRPTPDAAPYFQAFVVHKVHADGRFDGTFYGAPVSHGRINTQWGAVRIAFVTADGSGAYHHAAVLRGAALEGLTHSPGRGFLAVWSAVKP